MALDREPVRESDPVPVRSRTRTKTKIKKLKSSIRKESHSRSRSSSASRERKKKTGRRKADAENDRLKSPRISDSGSRMSYNPAASDRGNDFPVVHFCLYSLINNTWFSVLFIY